MFTSIPTLSAILVAVKWLTIVNAFRHNQTTRLRLSSGVADAVVSEHFHSFWRKPRSAEEVERHVYECLIRIPYDAMPLAPRVRVISAEPALVVIDDFLSHAMCQQIIDKAVETGNMKGSLVGEDQKTSHVRTSSTVWLKDEDCKHPLRLIADKVSLISGLPPNHMENLQVVRYEPGQQYDVHTDHKDSFNSLERLGRLATCLIYLSEPTSGGETWFPGVDESNEDIRIHPTKGSAVFFWNTIEKPGCQDYFPGMFLNVDLRLRHAGLPVETGEKWICNRWIHPINFGGGVRGLKV